MAIQKFYQDYRDDKRPILIITCPPQHGKSWSVEDAVSWFAGKNPDLRIVFSSFSDHLGIRCNSGVQRVILSNKYQKIFPDTHIGNKNVVAMATQYRRNSNHIEFVDKQGSFRNTTVGGPITGESLDIGFIDDPFKGRSEANSQLIRDKVWLWFTDDFGTRFSDTAGYVVIMTRWHTDDIVGRLIEKFKDQKNVTIFKFPAIAINNEYYRKEGEALFPELKSLEFLHGKKELMLDPAWEGLYQGNPIVESGNLINPTWWKWWEVLPKMEYTYAVADTAQKKNNWNDYTVFQCWARGLTEIYICSICFVTGYRRRN